MLLQQWKPRLLTFLSAFLLVLYLAGCTATLSPQPTPTAEPLAREIVFYDWVEDMPQSVLDAFTEEYGVSVKYLSYESQEEAIENIRAGQIYDIVVMESRFIPLLVRENLLAQLHQGNLSNSKNLSANFRELAYDPGNEYSIPYNWGTTGLVVRRDLVAEPVTRWTDLWDPLYAGKVGLWMGERREVIGLTLKSLGYSANSEDPAELEKALQRLIELKPYAMGLEEFDSYSSAGVLLSGQAVITMGYSSDFLEGSEQNPAIQYVLPEDGALLWNDTFVIPANSPNQSTAELLLDFLMRPKINAQIANGNQYATPNEAAYAFIEPGILNNPVIFPRNEDLANAELILPLTQTGQQLYDEIWERFTKAP